MSLSMSGHIDNDFDSQMALQFVPVTHTEENGVFHEVEGQPVDYTANIQPMSMKEISYLGIGLERINDIRKAYINSGDLTVLQSFSGYFLLGGVRYKPVMMDIRISRDYCKLILTKRDK